MKVKELKQVLSKIPDDLDVNIQYRIEETYVGYDGNGKALGVLLNSNKDEQGKVAVTDVTLLTDIVIYIDTFPG